MMPPFDEEHLHPRRIGTSRPHGKGVYEIAVFGDFDSKASSNIIDMIVSCNGRLIRHIFDGDAYSGKFAGFLFVDTTNLNCTVSQLVQKIRGLPKVTEVQLQYREGHIFGHFMFPLTVFGTKSVIAFRADGLVRMEEHLGQVMGSVAAPILYNEGRSYGSAVVSAYREVIPKGDERLLLENLKEGSKATGWGIFDFRFADDGRIHFVLRHPPTTSGGWKESRFLYGAFAGILEAVYNRRLAVSHTEYDKDKDILTIIYA